MTTRSCSSCYRVLRLTLFLSSLSMFLPLRHPHQVPVLPCAWGRGGDGPKWDKVKVITDFVLPGSRLTALKSFSHLNFIISSLMAQMVKNPPAMWETWVRSLGWEDPLQEGMETHSNILSLENLHGQRSLVGYSPWGHRVRQDWAIKARLIIQFGRQIVWWVEQAHLAVRRCWRWGFDPGVRKISWRRKWQPTPVFLWEKSHGQRSLASQRAGHH